MDPHASLYIPFKGYYIHNLFTAGRSYHNNNTTDTGHCSLQVCVSWSSEYKNFTCVFLPLPEERNLYISWCESTQIYKEAMLIAEMIKHIGYYPNI